MSCVYLHIGMHKTGSTAIQSAFSGFDDGKTRYADLGYENHSIPFYTAYSGNHQNYHVWRASGLHPDKIEAQKNICRARIEAAVAVAGTRNLIFSGEDISLLQHAAIEELRVLFAQFQCEVQVIVYVREPVSFVTTSIQEVIKLGPTKLYVQTPIYRERIEKFIEVFGVERVTVRVFDRKRLHANDIIADFAKQVGVKAPPKGKNNNTSLPTEAVKVIYLMNQLVSGLGEQVDLIRARRRMIAHVSASFTGPFLLPEALVAGIIQAEDIEWLYTATGVDFRRPEGQCRAFSEKALTDYLSNLDTNTLATIRKYLTRKCGIRYPPEETDLILARYFMSFMNTALIFGFRFNPDLYLKLNPDVKAAGDDPYMHYLMFGLANGRRVK